VGLPARLGCRSTAALWLAIGTTLALVLCCPVGQLRRLGLTLPIGIAAEIALSQVYGVPGALRLLTPRERTVLARAAVGETNAEIAKALYIGKSTVRKHLEHIYANGPPRKDGPCARGPVAGRGLVALSLGAPAGAVEDRAEAA
jgi:DNA-binding CsgD family transcriptional regulator